MSFCSMDSCHIAYIQSPLITKGMRKLLDLYFTITTFCIILYDQSLPLVLSKPTELTIPEKCVKTHTAFKFECTQESSRG